MFPNQSDIFSLFLVHDACLRSYFKNSWVVFHRGFQTLENNKSTRPTASCFHQFSRVWKPRWNTRTRFWNITSRPLELMAVGWKRSVRITFLFISVLLGLMSVYVHYVHELPQVSLFFSLFVFYFCLRFVSFNFFLSFIIVNL